MDFTTYETFLENLTSSVRGINNLIREAMSHKNLPLVWSPLQPDFVAVGKLESVKVARVNANCNSIIPFILQYIDEDNYVVELTYLVDDEHKYNVPCFSLSIGY